MAIPTGPLLTKEFMDLMRQAHDLNNIALQQNAMQYQTPTPPYQDPAFQPLYNQSNSYIQQIQNTFNTTENVTTGYMPSATPPSVILWIGNHGMQFFPNQAAEQPDPEVIALQKAMNDFADIRLKTANL